MRFGCHGLPFRRESQPADLALIVRRLRAVVKNSNERGSITERARQSHRSADPPRGAGASYPPMRGLRLRSRCAEQTRFFRKLYFREILEERHYYAT
jgi:hypothetical protein